MLSAASQRLGARAWAPSVADASDVRLERPVILFVEDNVALRYTVTDELENAGYRVIQVTAGEEAIRMLTGAARIDALLTDLRLPGLIDGWDIAERARQLRPDLPVIYASAYSYVTPRQVPGSLMLNKPYKPETLLDALGSLLG